MHGGCSQRYLLIYIGSESFIDVLLLTPEIFLYRNPVEQPSNKSNKMHGSVALLSLWFCSAGRRERLRSVPSPLDVLRDQRGGYCRGAHRNPGWFSARWAAGNKVRPLGVGSFQKLPGGRINEEKRQPWKGSATAGFHRCFSLPSCGVESSLLTCASISDKISKQAELTPAGNYSTFHTDLGYTSYGPHHEKEMILAI